MPSPKSHRRGQEDRNQNRRGRLSERSSSFHSESPTSNSLQLRRPKTLPDLLASSRNPAGISFSDGPPKLTKLLLNVTIQGSFGAIHVLMSPESTVRDLVTAAVRQYAKEVRRPILTATDPSKFDLHYSQFSLESLDREEKLISLGSRNFFLCLRKSATDQSGIGSGGGGGVAPTPSSSCSKEASKAVAKTGFAKFMDFLL